MTPSSHTHGNIDNGGIVKISGTAQASKNVVTDSNGKITTENKPTIPTGSSTATDIKMNGTQSAGSSSNFAKADHVHPVDTSRAASSHTHTKANITDFPTSMTPSSHTHGNITNAGAIGSTANIPIITGDSGVLKASSFGTAANTFCQGNDSRLSNTRTPTFNAIGATSSNTKNLNDYKTGGFYYCQNDSTEAPYISNQPLTSGQKSFFMLVETWGASNTKYAKQTLTYYNSNDTYTRTCNNGTWGSWKKLCEVSFSQTKTSGTEIGTITINGTATKLYQQDNNTTYTAGTGLTLSNGAFSLTDASNYIKKSSTSGYIKNDGTIGTPTNTTYANGTGLNLSGTTFSVKYGTASGTACQGNDSRITNLLNEAVSVKVTDSKNTDDMLNLDVKQGTAITATIRAADGTTPSNLVACVFEFSTVYSKPVDSTGKSSLTISSSFPTGVHIGHVYVMGSRGCIAAGIFRINVYT